MLSVVAFFVFSRYRLPAVPGLLLLAAIPVARAAEAFRAGERRKSGAMWAGVAILWLAPHVPGYAPRADLVEFNLGRLAEERGDLRRRCRALRAHARRRSGEPLGDAQPRQPRRPRRRLRGSRESRFERAVALAPDSDDAHANLGGALLALGDLAGRGARARSAPSSSTPRTASRGTIWRFSGGSARGAQPRSTRGATRASPHRGCRAFPSRPSTPRPAGRRPARSRWSRSAPAVAPPEDTDG